MKVPSTSSTASTDINTRDHVANNGCANLLHALAVIVAYGLIFFSGFPLFVWLCFPDPNRSDYFTAAWGGMAAICLACAVRARGIAATVAITGSLSLILSLAIVASVVDFDRQGVFFGTSFPFLVITLWFDYRILRNLSRGGGSKWQVSVRDIGVVVIVIISFVTTWVLVTH